VWKVVVRSSAKFRSKNDTLTVVYSLSVLCDYVGYLKTRLPSGTVLTVDLTPTVVLLSIAEKRRLSRSLTHSPTKQCQIVSDVNRINVSQSSVFILNIIIFKVFFKIILFFIIILSVI